MRLPAIALMCLVATGCSTVERTESEERQVIVCERDPPAEGSCILHPDPPVPQIRVREVEYTVDGAVHRGRLAIPVPLEHPCPAVLVVHEWWGRGAHADQSAEELARLGYVGFALDMYGGAKTTKDPAEAGKWAGEAKKDPAVAIRRFRAALDVVRALPEVDGKRVASIGYCFGGTVSLDAAWSGLDLRGVVSFHGSLTTPTAEQAKAVTASILVCHGADDEFVSQQSIDAFVASMKENDFDWEFVSYGNAVHSFTNESADGTFHRSVKYEPRAAARSWEVMKDFLAERFAP